MKKRISLWMVDWLESRVFLSGTGNVGALEPMAPSAGPLPDLRPAVTPSGTFPLTSVPQLSSLPSAPVNVYLNFVGDTVNDWPLTNPATKQDYSPGVIPAYDDNGDATTFSSTELANIQSIWAEVADKYSPFNINVTTIKPANLSHNVSVQIDIGGTNAWLGMGGGYSIIGGFTNTNAEANVGFVFSAQAPDNLNFVATGAAHEAGHNFGLNHQGTVSNGVVTEYSNGDATTVPIMGNAGNNPGKRGIWFDGTETGVDGNGNAIVIGTQDDLQTIASGTNNITYRPDEYSYSTYVTMTPAVDWSISGYSGVINDSLDTDPFAFVAQGTGANFTIKDPTTTGMLAPTATIRTSTSSHTVIATSSDGYTSSTISTTGLTPGTTYFLTVAGQGGYGDIGEYTITGTLPSFAYLSNNPTGTLVVTGYGSTIANNLSVSESGSNFVLYDGGDGGGATLNFPVSSVSSILISLGTGNDSVNLNAGLGDSVPVTVNGGGGTDALTLNNLTTPTTIYNTWASAPGIDVPLISGFTTATFNATSAGTNFYVHGMSIISGGQAVINGGTGNDTLTLEGDGFDSMPTFTFNGNGGTNTFYTNNFVATTPWTYVLTDSQFTATQTGSPTVTENFSGVSSFEVVAGSGGDYFEPRTTGTSDSVELFGGSGDDTFNLYNAVGYYTIGGTLGTGPAGNNTVDFDDSGSSAATYTLNTSSLTRSSLILSLSYIQSLVINPGTGAVTTTITGLPAATVTVNGSVGGSTVTVSNNGILPSFNSGLTINLATTLTINDSSGPANTATLTATSFTAGSGTLYYSRITNLSYYMPHTATPVLNVISDNVNTNYAISSNGDGDVYLGSNGNLSNIQTTSSPLGNTTFTITQMALVTVDDSTNPVSQTYTMTSSGLIVQGLFTLTLGTSEPLVLKASAGTDIINVTGNYIGSPDTINCGTGADTVTLGSTANFLGSALNSYVTVNGGGGPDTLTIFNYEPYAIVIGSTFVGYGSPSSYYPAYGVTGLTSLYLTDTDQTYSGSVYVTGTGAGTAITLQTSNKQQAIDVIATSPTGSFTLAPATGNNTVTVGSSDGSTSAVLAIAASQALGATVINPGGTLVVSAGARELLQLASLTESGSAVLNLTTNDLDLPGASLASVTALVKSGYGPTGGKYWAGPGIDSSTAASDTSHIYGLGVVQNNQSGTSLFSSSKLLDGSAPGASDILVRSTFEGDATIDGKVDGSDYSRIDAGYLSHATSWFNGDFNYDGVINGSDYTLVDNAFNRQGAQLTASIAVAPATASAHLSTPAFPLQNLPGANADEWSLDERRKHKAVVLD